MPHRRRVIALAVGILLLVGSQGSVVALGDTASRQPDITAVKKQRMMKIKQLRGQIALHRQQTWRWQDKSGVARTPTIYRERRVRGIAYLKWLSALWSDRTVAAKRYSVSLMAVVRHADRSLVQAGHARSPLRKELIGIVKASKAEGISPYFILAIAGKESTFGLATCGKNAWGWNRCSTNGWRTFAEGARTVARGLRVNYLGKWGSRTVPEVGYDYCGRSCGSSWSSGVGYFMSHIFKAGSGMRWKDALRTALKTRARGVRLRAGTRPFGKYL